MRSFTREAFHCLCCFSFFRGPCLPAAHRKHEDVPPGPDCRLVIAPALNVNAAILFCICNELAMLRSI